jgi:uncharacterized protein (DUF2236 family)
MCGRSRPWSVTVILRKEL